MDTKNVIAAISLSAAVIVLYALFFPPSPTQKSQDFSEKNKIEQNSDMPTLEQKKKVIKISRDEAINQNDRINFEKKFKSELDTLDISTIDCSTKKVS